MPGPAASATSVGAGSPRGGGGGPGGQVHIAFKSMSHVKSPK